MASRTSPTVRRRRLASEMRRLRRESGKTREEAARFADIAPATVSRIEAAVHAPKVADIMALCKFYGLDDERTDVLVTLARQSRQRGWWQKYGDAIPAWFEVYVGLEEEVSELRTYQSEVIFGLLQTEAYARAVLLADDNVSPDDGERMLEVRMRRQKLLDEGPERPKLWIIQNEAALRREVGGRAVMHEQLDRLMTISQLPGVTIQVLPLSSGAHPSMHGSFEILGFPDRRDPDVVYVDYRNGCIYLEGPGEVDDYAQLFNQLRARALGPDETRALIGEVVQRMA
ncbi:XRE family transcriptional regulator [Actinomadura sp. GC306]|uniref:helix-turn-helix domain-containing protein n=1 Tax=Actinomadura sp. GC306 TaxID=2530367 RepID=UPI00104C7049|nr:helix-turn-helix transcriptional regulator [Actinomadura sp. GC306]TDC61950.1 XRE family transcriptional regulator [Actinomadura sp. GC306]